MAKIRLTKVMKDYIKEELMAPITEWYDGEYERITQEKEKDLKKLFVLSDSYADTLMATMETLSYESSDENALKSRLRKDVEYICNSRLVQTRDDKNLLQLREKFNARKLEVNKALVQIELECALGTDKEEFMSLLNDHKEKLQEGL